MSKIKNARGYEIISVGEGDNILSHYRRWINKYDMPINVPVVDVRDGMVERMLAESMERAQNKSRWINYNEYHVSQKTKKTL